MRITIIATGFENEQGQPTKPAAPALTKDPAPIARTQPKVAPAAPVVETVAPRKPARSAVDTELDQLMRDFQSAKNKKKSIR